jgi:predicted ribonuclease YlaK
MARKRRSNDTSQTNVDGLMRRQNKKRNPINSQLLLNIEPMTKTQVVLFDSYSEGKNIVAYGSAGTGKTFCVLYNALREVLDEKSPYEKIYIIRSIVSTRDVGFLPGMLEEKIEMYEMPYKYMVKFMFQLASDEDFSMLYGNLKSQKTIEFSSTSFIRGITYDNCIIIVDEFSNLNFHELDSIITRIGENSKICFCGDAEQSDLVRTSERNGIIDFMDILRKMPSFDIIEFGIEDVIRSGLVKEYLTVKHELGISSI